MGELIVINESDDKGKTSDVGTGLLVFNGLNNILLVR